MIGDGGAVTPRRRPGRRPRPRRRAGARGGGRRNARPGRRRRRRPASPARASDHRAPTPGRPATPRSPTSPDGRVVVASAGRIVLLDASDGEELASVDDATTLVAIAVGPTDGVAVLGASADGTIRTWSRDADVARRRRHRRDARADRPAAAARRIARRSTGAGDGRRRVGAGQPHDRDRRERRPRRVGPGRDRPVRSVRGDRRRPADGLGSDDRTARLRRPGAGERAGVERSDATPTVACKLVSAGESLDVWEPAAGRRVRLADQTNAQAVAISGDGSTVVTAGWGATVAVWKLTAQIDDTGRVELAPPGPLTVGRSGEPERWRGTTARRRSKCVIDGVVDECGDRSDHRARAHRRRLPRCWSTAPTGCDCSRPRTAHRSTSTPAATVIASR